jgi:hypothetical protein
MTSKGPKKRATISRSRRDPFETVQLSAKVSADRAKSGEMTQGDLCEAFDVTDQTVRNWVARGLPVRKGPLGKPRYPQSEALAWGRCWRQLEQQKRAPKWLTPPTAIFLELLGQKEIDDEQPWTEKEGPLFVIVPLEWDHPIRERMLQVAARGVRPITETVVGESPTEVYAAVVGAAE